MKTLMIGTGILLILVAVALILAATQLKTVAHTAIERSVGIAFLTDVSVEDVDIGLREGEVKGRQGPARFDGYHPEKDPYFRTLLQVVAGYHGP
ncbi:MAG: hypothetical protein U9Q79_05790, partial [Candidatus Hydrogenedentes bacterium]|nr:hypothetical protein [Candidatus Hydrogenedentota bacterium]